MESFVFTKSILKKPDPEDGKRISVMSRHTLSDGITEDTRITKDSFNEWIKELAPPLKLIGDYYKRGLQWSDFKERYLAFLRQPDTKEKVKFLADRCVGETITLLCIEDEHHMCHRSILAEELKSYRPELVIVHK
jgi:uncharacterized protein YeaO (DUF488 family)